MTKAQVPHPIMTKNRYENHLPLIGKFAQYTVNIGWLAHITSGAYTKIVTI